MQGYARGTGECQRHEDPRMQRGGSVGGVCSENDVREARGLVHANRRVHSPC